jgi:prefoldin subunit 5
MSDMTNQLFGVKARLDLLSSQIATLQGQVAALQLSISQIHSLDIDDSGNFTTPEFTIEDDKD